MAQSPLRVIIGGSYWAMNGVNVFSANLAQGLRARGVDAHILLTEERTALIAINDAMMRRPKDVPVVELPVGRSRGWGAHWGAMIRYLEDRAPCVYIPNSDWRHSSVTPLLSRNVHVVGVVHSDDPLHYDHVRRLGPYWDAVVTTTGTIAAKTIALNPELRERTQVIPIGVDIPDVRRARRRAPGPLRVIYPGSLKQHQKRVLDLPRIVAAAARRRVPMTLTIAGGGPDEAKLRRASARLVERGLITFLGVVEHTRLLKLLEAHDVFLMTSEFEGMPNALLEAMGRGCVPLVTDMESAVPDLVADGDSGFVVPIGGIDAFVDRLATLAADRDGWARMSTRAYDTVSAGNFRVRDMVESYLTLGRDLVEGRASFTRPAGELNHPPPDIDGVGIFPVALPFHVPGVGAFPSETRDFAEFKNEIRELQRPEASPLAWLAAQAKAERPQAGALNGVTVIVGVNVWLDTGWHETAVNLVRTLRARGVSAHFLLTEERSPLVNIPLPRLPFADDVPFEYLQMEEESWGGHWGAIVRYLEERAPCIYLPTQDWRHSCVSPLLSDRVAVVGIVGANDPLDRDHVQRLGRWWNAIIVHDDTTLAELRQTGAEWAGRVHLAPYGMPRPATLPARRRRGAPLRLACDVHGSKADRDFVSALKSALRRRRTPAQITLVPADGAVFGSAFRAWAARARVTLFDRDRDQAWIDMFTQQDVVLIREAPDGAWPLLTRAAATGCIPVALSSRRNAGRWRTMLSDGEYGYVVEGSTMDPVADLLSRLYRSPAERAAAAARTFEEAPSGSTIDDMTDAYLKVFVDALTAMRDGSFRRPTGELNHPPRQVGGASLFTLDLHCAVPGVGRFPWMSDYVAFREQVRHVPRTPAAERAVDPEQIDRPHDADGPGRRRA